MTIATLATTLLNASASANPIVSYYIPRVRKYHTQQSIINMFYANAIGYVRRVDFVPIEGRDADNFVSAYVHFDCLYDSPIQRDIYQTIVYGANGQGREAFKFYLSEMEYWLINLNLTPIPETILNIHQIDENHKILEDRVNELEATIHMLRDILEKYINPPVKEDDFDFDFDKLTLNDLSTPEHKFSSLEWECAPEKREAKKCKYDLDDVKMQMDEFIDQMEGANLDEFIAANTNTK
jgi:hypothetical protein